MTPTITPEMIDRAARHLRETQQAGKKLTPWADLPNSPKRKWIELARGTLNAAIGHTA